MDHMRGEPRDSGWHGGVLAHSLSGACRAGLPREASEPGCGAAGGLSKFSMRAYDAGPRP